MALCAVACKEKRMPSFDVVNRVDLQEVENAVNNTRKVISTRFDFKGSNTELTFDKKACEIHIVTSDTMKLQAVDDTLATHLAKRKVDVKTLDRKEPEPTSKGHIKQDIKLHEGIDRETAKKITKMIKDTKLKVQTQIQDDQVRVTAKKIDDLQAVIAMLKEKKLEVPLQYINMKS